MLFKNVCQITEIDRIAYDSQTNKFEEEEKKNDIYGEFTCWHDTNNKWELNVRVKWLPPADRVRRWNQLENKQAHILRLC